MCCSLFVVVVRWLLVVVWCVVCCVLLFVVCYVLRVDYYIYILGGRVCAVACSLCVVRLFFVRCLVLNVVSHVLCLLVV